MSQTKLVPYLFFGGRTEEALEFYRQAVGAEVGMVMKYNQSPDPAPEGMLPPDFGDKVMHAEFSVHGETIFAGDGCGEPLNFAGFSLALSVPTVAAAHQAFDGLSAGGEASMPLTKTFWSPCFGMLRDKFGVNWMVMVPGEQP